MATRHKVPSNLGILSRPRVYSDMSAQSEQRARWVERLRPSGISDLQTRYNGRLAYCWCDGAEHSVVHRDNACLVSTRDSRLFCCLIFLRPSVSDVTAIWNSNAFWAYVLSVKINSHVWETRKLVSVIIASVGVLMVVYGSQTEQSTSAVNGTSSFDAPSAPFIGNVLTLVASFAYGLYQVMYKRFAALPDELSRSSPSTWRRLSLSSVTRSTDSIEDVSLLRDGDAECVQPIPFGLYPNFLTSCMGLLTFIVMWIFIPILDYTNVERFTLPTDIWTSVCIFGIVCTGVMFYMTFMVRKLSSVSTGSLTNRLQILLGVWGPVVTSVGNLLTIVLVMLSDVILGNAVGSLTLWGIAGSTMVVCAFAVLAHDSLQ